MPQIQLWLTIVHVCKLYLLTYLVIFLVDPYVICSENVSFNHWLDLSKSRDWCLQLSCWLLQEAGSQETSSVGDWHTENIDELIEVNSVSSLDSTARTVTEQFFSRHSETPRTPLDQENHTAGTNLRCGFYCGTPLSVNTSSQVVENRSRHWSSTVEVSSMASNCSSRASQVTVPATSSCTSELPRSAETFDESRENRFHRNPDSTPTSPTIAFRQSFKIRLLEHVGINPTWNLEEQCNASTSRHPAWVGSDGLEPKGEVLWESKTTGDCGRVHQSPLDLIGSQSTSSHHQNADRLPPTEDLGLPGLPSTWAESSMKFPASLCQQFEWWCLPGESCMDQWRHTVVQSYWGHVCCQ